MSLGYVFLIVYLISAIPHLTIFRDHVQALKALSAVVAIPRFFSHPSLSSPLFWKDLSYSKFLANHIRLSIVTFLTLGLCTYLAIDKIRQNKQTENLRANSEPNTCVYTASINDVLEEQNQL